MNTHCKPMDRNADIPEGPSKSQLKREMEALQKLGEELVALPQDQLAALPLPDTLRDAVQLARRITSHGALKRQRQYIGRLMRELDAEPIRIRLDELRGTDLAMKARFRENQRWRDRLLAEGDAALAEFLARHPQADRQHLRRLMRRAGGEDGGGRPPEYVRELFRYIQGLD